MKGGTAGETRGVRRGILREDGVERKKKIEEETRRRLTDEARKDLKGLHYVRCHNAVWS
jgi:hypothetical protein